MPTQRTADTSDIGTFPESRFVTLADAARHTGVSEDTIRRRIKDGTIPAILLAGRYRIREDHLREWMTGQAAA